MSSINKIFAGLVQLAFTVGGYIVAGPIGAFIGSFIGAIAGAVLANAIFPNRQGTQADLGKVNVRAPEPPRWLNAGRMKQGGGVLFAEFDDDGNLWYLVVHTDSRLINIVQYYLDGIPVTIDGSGNVLTKDFRLKTNKEKDLAEFDGQGQAYFQIWTTTYSASDPTPPAITAFKAAFPTLWTDDHKLVGTTYSVVRIAAIKTEHRYKIYKWRGPLGLGEPSISIVGDWGTAYDPRDIEQAVNDATTHTFTRNPVLQWAWFRTHPYGRNKPRNSINWDKIAEQAEICDEIVTGIAGDHVRYQCDIAIPEDKQRSEAEKEILITMDGQIVFDDDGKSWVRVGYYYEPTLKITRNRDIVAMETMEAIDGESETQGVVVRYTDPDAQYAVQPSAAWLNPLYYVEGETATFLTVDALAIQDHNQAMRIAKAIGLRVQPLHKAVPTTGLRGLRAMKERILEMQYDNTFAGDYEIATQVEMDKSGQLCRIGVVPVDANRWTLLEGEEKPKPVVNDSAGSQLTEQPTNTTLSIVDGQLRVTFDPPLREDITFQYQYIVSAEIGGGDDTWLPMTVDMGSLIAIGGNIEPNVEYSVRGRGLLGSGLASAWAGPFTIEQGTAIDPATMLTATGNVGNADIAWRNPNSSSFGYSDIWRNTTTDFGTATKIVAELFGGLGQVQGITDTAAAGTYYYWVVSNATDDTAATPTGPVSATIT